MVTEEKPIVRMTADSMEAYVMLITPDDGGEYTIESLQKALDDRGVKYGIDEACLLYTSPSPRDLSTSRMPSSA